MFIEASSYTQRRLRSSGLGPSASLKRLQHTDISLHIRAVAIKSISVVRDLGLLLYSELSMRQDIGNLTGLCYHQLRRLKKIRRILGPSITCSLMSAFVSSRLDYCNLTLAGLPMSTIAHLQRVQNAAVRLVCGLGPRDHVTNLCVSYIGYQFGSASCTSCA